MKPPSSLAALRTPAVLVRLAGLLGLIVTLLLLAWAWRHDDVQGWLRSGAALAWLRAQAASLGPWAIWLLMSTALCLALPLSVLSLLVLAALGPAWGLALCFASAGLSALISHRIGHLLGHALLLRLAGPRVQHLSAALGRRGLLAVVLMRLTPVAPFAVVNMVAGATHIRAWQMVVGTWIGMAPSTVVMALFLEPLMQLIGQLDLPRTAALVIAVLAGAGALVWRRRRAGRQRGGRA